MAATDSMTSSLRQSREEDRVSSTLPAAWKTFPNRGIYSNDSQRNSYTFNCIALDTFTKILNSRSHFLQNEDYLPAARIKSRQSSESVEGRWLDIDEVRLVSDLRVMHSKVDELYYIVSNLKRRHSEADIHKYADPPVLAEDIAKVDEIYVWFIKLKEERERLGRYRSK